MASVASKLKNSQVLKLEKELQIRKAVRWE